MDIFAHGWVGSPGEWNELEEGEREATSVIENAITAAASFCFGGGHTHKHAADGDEVHTVFITSSKWKSCSVEHLGTLIRKEAIDLYFKMIPLRNGESLSKKRR